MNNYYYVYILSSISFKLYIGITNDLIRRIFEHKETVQQKLSANKNELFKVDFSLNFTCRYNVDRLVYFEQFESAEAAIIREKELKGWTRKKKIDLIQQMNPEFTDLYSSIV